jgi:hypothetical protein
MPKKVRLMPKRLENVNYLRGLILFRSASCHALKGGCPLGGGQDIPQKNLSGLACLLTMSNPVS